MPRPAGDGVCETMFVVCSVRSLSPRLPVIVPFLRLRRRRLQCSHPRSDVGCPPSSSRSAPRKDDDGAGLCLPRSLGLEAGTSNSRMN